MLTSASTIREIIYLGLPLLMLGGGAACILVAADRFSSAACRIRGTFLLAVPLAVVGCASLYRMHLTREHLEAPFQPIFEILLVMAAFMLSAGASYYIQGLRNDKCVRKSCVGSRSVRATIIRTAKWLKPSCIQLLRLLSRPLLDGEVQEIKEILKKNS